MSNELPDIGISVGYENLLNLPSILSPKIYLDFTSDTLPVGVFDSIDSLSFHDIGRFYEPLFDGTQAFTFMSSYGKQLLFFPNSKVGFIGGFSISPQGFYCKSFVTPPLGTLGYGNSWEISFGFVDFSFTENIPYPDGYVGQGIWAVFSSDTSTIEIRYLDAAQNEQILESTKFSIENTAGNPVEIGFQWDGFKSFKAYYGNYSVISRSEIVDSFSSGQFYPVAIMDSIYSSGPINGGMDSLEFGCSIGFNNLNPSATDRGITLSNISTSDYINLETADKNIFDSNIRNLGLENIFTLDNCAPEYCIPAGDVDEGNVRIGVISNNDSKFEEPICEYIRTDFSEGATYGLYSNGDKIRIVESSLGNQYLILRNLNTNILAFVEIIDNEFGGGIITAYGDLRNFEWFNDKLWVCGQDSGYSIRSFSAAFNYETPDINIANSSTCNSIAYHEDTNSLYASYPEDNLIVQYDADDGSVLDNISITSFDIVKLISCGDYIGIIDREPAPDVLSDSSRIRFLNPENNTQIKSYPASDPNDAIYDAENNCVYFLWGETSATPTPEIDGITVLRLGLASLANATPTLTATVLFTTSQPERNISDWFVYENSIYIISNGNLYIRSTSDGSLISTETFDHEVLSISHQNVEAATPVDDIIWTIGIDTSATPVADGNMLFYKNCSTANKLGIKVATLILQDSATPYELPNLIEVNQINEFINECIDNDQIPLFAIFMEDWDNVEENKQSINEIIEYIHESFIYTKIPVYLTVLPTPDLNPDPDLTEDERLFYWGIYQRYTRRLLDLGINNGVKDYSYISLIATVSAEHIVAMIQSPSLESTMWIENVFDMVSLVATIEITDFDYTEEVLLDLASDTFNWFNSKNVANLIVSFIFVAGEGGPLFEDNAADFYDAAYDLAINSGASATPNIPHIVGILMNDSVLEASGSYLREIKLSLGYETSLMGSQGQQSKILYNSETFEDFCSYVSDFILDNQIFYLIFGDKNTFDNIVESGGAGNAVDYYIELFNEIQQNVSGPYRLYGPNIDISARDEDYDVTYNTVLMDSRYVTYLQDFINSINSATPTFNPSGLVFSGDFSAEDWQNVISYIRNTLLFNGEIIVSNIDPNPSYDSNLSYKQKSQSVINELGPADKVFLTEDYIFTGSFENLTAEWAFIGSLKLISQANNVIFNIVNYSESILQDGYIEIISEDAATPYTYSSDFPISGSLIKLGNLEAGTYSVKIFGTVGEDGEASMNLKFEFDNFNDVSLTSKKYFYLGG